MWTSVKYLPENLPETIEMTREYYGDSWISDSDFLKWQYEANPAGPAMIRLARDVETDQLAGQYVVIPMRFKAFNELIEGTLSLNTLTRQIYGGQGIFTGLAKAVYQDCAEQGSLFCYGFPNPNSYPGFIRKLGFTDLGSVPLLLRPLNTNALVRKRLGSLLATLSLPFHFYYKVKDRSDERYEVYPLTPSNLSEMNAFWAKVQDKYPIMGIRDADYLRWRYFDIPLRDYQVYGVRQKNSTQLLGYIVGRCTEVASMSSGMIVDFLVDSEHPAAGNCLVNTLLRFFVDKNMDLAGSLMMPHTEESRILKGNGFFTCPKSFEPQPFPVIYRRLGPLKGNYKEGEKDDDPFLRLNQWFLTMGDYDVI
ncbi:GNAT family N-acetyltransferase [Desulfosporosinus lacus]|uniref:Acetyltransferase (GNAT) domain-containing protein n=1 Tax=Desulfosporosinus lacus DSM 15449 TaxID=1121420 RepID=A0A1M5RW36_9FIRM|nr:GNAT family N-acetyltransferase [Desulfosporosinus lacus]SHH30537.1 Acetyltransferase (GNAT) domain-containing protein [Desulfosporosinus lacus DSM 15449]